MSGRNPTKRSEEWLCARCGNPPPTWKKQMQKGESVRWLCGRCVHAAGEAKKYAVDYLVLDKPTCSACTKAFTREEKRYFDEGAGYKYRGVVCRPCHQLLRACGNDSDRLLDMLVYMRRIRRDDVMLPIGKEE